MLKKGGIDFRCEAVARGKYLSTMFTGAVAVFSLQANSSCTGSVAMLLRFLLGVIVLLDMALWCVVEGGWVMGTELGLWM